MITTLIFYTSILTFLLMIFFSIFGIFVFRKHLINVLISIEMLFLSVSCFFILFGIYLQDILGQLIALFIITVAAAESAIALALLTMYYRLTGFLTVEFLIHIKG